MAYCYASQKLRLNPLVFSTIQVGQCLLRKSSKLIGEILFLMYEGESFMSCPIMKIYEQESCSEVHNFLAFGIIIITYGRECCI